MPNLRIAVVSTPRSGNTWIRATLAGLYGGLPQLTVNDITRESIQTYPAECMVQCHWKRRADFEGRLRRNGFQILTISRHPLDVLVSILHFCTHEPETEKWLLGAGGTETPIRQSSPLDRAFLRYACGPRAAELLGVTADWWGRKDVVSVRYEDYVADPQGQLLKLAEQFGPPRVPDLEPVVGCMTFDRLQPTSANHHYWQGQPGNWRRLLPAATARAIYEAHRPIFMKLGYTCDPDPTLTRRLAHQNWRQLVKRDPQPSRFRFWALLNSLGSRRQIG